MSLRDELAVQVGSLKARQAAKLKASFPKVTKKVGDKLEPGDICYITGGTGSWYFKIARYLKTTEEEWDREKYNVHHFEEFWNLPNSISTHGASRYDKEFSFDYNVLLERHVDKCNRVIEEEKELINLSSEESVRFQSMLHKMYE